MTEYIYEHKPSGADHMGKPVELPTLVQREEIVRCRDCEHWIPFGIGNPKPDCWASGEPFKTEPDGFCAWGERRQS